MTDAFVVRDLPWTIDKLRTVPPFEFENWAVIAVGGIPTKAQAAQCTEGRATFQVVRAQSNDG